MSGFLGQGKVFVGLRLASGLPDISRWIGNASVFKLGMEEDSIERNESYSGNRLPLRRATRTRQGTVQIVFDEFSDDNAALALIGAKTTVAAGSPQTNVALAATVGNPAKVGDTLIIPGHNLSAVTIKDSTGSPKTLTLDTNYSLDAFAGSIDILNLTTGGPFVMPLTADFTPGQRTVVGAFKTVSPEVYVRLNGINTDDGSRVIVDVFRSRLSPAREFNLIGDDFADFELNGSMLADLTRLQSAAGGQFFSITRA
ncbi:MAG: hypothetical protein KIT60_07075 [Burkholderiaceae bacterium]|nr:hypothetical protein [Burkholderiaceae bacterium]